MTADEREKTIAALVKKHLGFTNGEIASASYRAFVDAIYDAGRSAGLEDAAKIVEAYIEARPHTVAAAIRALITAPQKG